MKASRSGQSPSVGGHDTTSVDPPAGSHLLTGGGIVEVVGESYRHAAIAAAVGAGGPDGVWVRMWATLDPRDDNPVDSNAVAVVIDGQQVGYLSRADAARYRPILEQVRQGGWTACCRADISGGWDRGADDRGEFSVALHLGPPAQQHAVLAELHAGGALVDVGQSATMQGPGVVRGRPYFEWLEEAQALLASGRDADAEVLLCELTDAAEVESTFEGVGLAPEPFALLAALYRARGDALAERQVLERFSAAEHDRAPGSGALLARLSALQG